MEYTKGEWYWESHDSGEAQQNLRCKVANGNNHILYTVKGVRTKADAQLIASAPDLYEACKGIISALEYTGWIDSIDHTVVAHIEEVKKAIAKVEKLDNYH